MSGRIPPDRGGQGAPIGSRGDHGHRRRGRRGPVPQRAGAGRRAGGDHRDRERRRRRRAARAAHQSRPRHDHLHARRRHQPETGWGLAGESWQAMETLGRYGGATWFNLGDRDLGTHLYRTAAPHEGATLSQVTAEIAAAWGLELRLLPATDDPLRTSTITVAGGRRRDQLPGVLRARQHSVPVRASASTAPTSARPRPVCSRRSPTPSCVVIAPSNPLVSIDPVLAVPGVRDAVTRPGETGPSRSRRSSPAPRSRVRPTG